MAFHAFLTWYLGTKDAGAYLMAHVFLPFAFGFALLTVAKKNYRTIITAFTFGVASSAAVAWIYGPLLLAPVLITAHETLFALLRPWKVRLYVILTSCLAWTVSVFGQRWGLFPETLRFVNDGIEIHSSIIALPEYKTTRFFYTAGLTAIIAPALVIGAIRGAYHRAETGSRLQAWQLRRLVSK